jgi:hypothetical protein
VTGMIFPGLIAGALVGLRWDENPGFQAQSSSDFMVIPLCIDLGIFFYPCSFIKNTNGLVCSSNSDGINLVATQDSAFTLALVSIFVLVWNVKRVESKLDRKSWHWLLGWSLCLSLVGLHTIHFAGMI